MEQFGNKNQGGEEVYEINTFPVPFPLRENYGNFTIHTNTPSKPSKEQIINQAFKFHSQGNIQEAAKYYQYFIDQGFNDHRAFSNYGVILQNLGKLKKAELSYRKAIELNPNFAMAYSNLGVILTDLGKLQEAELSTRKAIELKPDYADAHNNLGSVLKNLGKLQEAELSIRKAIELKPDYADAAWNLYGLSNSIEEAVAKINLCLKLDENHLKAKPTLIALKFHQVDQSLFENLSKSLKIFQNLSKSFEVLQICLKSLHRFPSNSFQNLTKSFKIL